MRKLIFYISIFIFPFFGSAQYHFSFSHYTSDNGLSQNSITAIVKDKQGYIWFGTRDGLNRFDGYSFKNYSSKLENKLSILSNRILEIKEDKWGFIWIKTYDDIVYRLNTATEIFERIQSPNGGINKSKINEMFILPSGRIWLTTFDSGCYAIETNQDSHKLIITAYNKKNKKLKSDQVESIFEDKENNTWILTQNSLCLLENNGKTSYLFDNLSFINYIENEKRIIFGCVGKIIQYEKRTKTFNKIDLPNGESIVNLASFSPNNYLFSTQGKGFFTFDVLSSELKLFSVEKYPEMKTNNIQNIYIDRAGDAWLGIRSSGVLHFKPQTNKINYISSNINIGQISNPNFLIFEDEKDLLWIQPYYGSFSWFDRVNNRLVPFNSVYNVDINTLFSYGVNHVLSDSQGVLWISTNRGNGFFKCTFLPDYFNHHLLDNKSVYSISNETRSIFEDREKRLWVATKDGVIHVFNDNKQQIGTLNSDGRIKQGGNLDVLVYGFFQDKKGIIWLATKRQGVFRLIPQSTKNTFKIERFTHNPNDPYSPVNNDFYSITQDNTGRIWAGSYGGGLHLIEELNGKIRFIHARNEFKTYPISNCSKVRQIFVDSKQHIWVATTEGIVVFKSNFKNYNNIPFIYYNKNESINNGLGANDVHNITEDSEGVMWFGTFGGGLNKLKTKSIVNNKFEFEIIDRLKGLPNNIVYTILDDKQGNLWLTTENAIVKLNKNSGFFEIFGKGNELENVEFSEASACLLASGEICVGSKSGFYSFKPEAVIRRVITAPLVFTRLLMFNKEVEVGGEKSILQSQLDKTSKIEFTHKQNVFTIEFATLDMRAPEKIQYSYLLEGFDKEWNNVQTKHFATYTALPPGTYTFRVKSTDSEGIWLSNERQIEIEILPSFWQSIFAKILYVFLILGVFLLALYIFITIFKLKNNVHLEKQMTDMKLRFFTDISHELRTPLTLISLPVDNLLEEDIDPSIKEQLSHVRSNLDRVLMLINQILDFRKLQNNKMRLTIEEVDFGAFVSECSSNFIEMAQAKGINFKIENISNGVKVWIDPERFDSIIYNLISNAIKFTPAGKNIIIKTETTPNSAVLSVIDEGIGIAQEKINFIFDRFFSISTIRSLTQKSTGIGLDLVKKMVDLHHATIHVDSQIDKGSTFRIEFKLGVMHFENEDVDIIVSDIKVPAEKFGETNDIDTPVEIAVFENEKLSPLILIVEDNDELRHFLKNSLKNHYRVAEAQNGLKGWKKVESLLPDIIIADLRMPEMDGMELTVKIREDKRTSHIPVILLTAVTDMESKLAGMKAGADDYITKPFNSAFLHARIENLMNQRKQLQQFYRTQIVSSKPDFSLPPLEVQSQDELFMEHLIQIMNNNIENFDLNIDFLANKLNMSRTVFFNKLKSLTGYSPVEFVREVRFERATEYITDTNLSVSEVSYKVGIDDPRYFSRCFKLKYGLTPSEYRVKHLKSKDVN